MTDPVDVITDFLRKIPFVVTTLYAESISKDVVAALEASGFKIVRFVDDTRENNIWESPTLQQARKEVCEEMKTLQSVAMTDTVETIMHELKTATLTVIADLRASEERIKKLEEALEYYADKSEYTGGEEASIFDDRGNRARQALGE